MIVGVPRESKRDEYRVAMLPVGVEELVRAGHTAVVERSAGAGSGLTDEAYARYGAALVETAAEVFARAALIVKVKEPQPPELRLIRDVVHYCVTNMPGAVGRTSTYALCNATLPYVIELASQGVEAAARRSPAIRSAVNVFAGRLVQPAVAAAFGLPCETFLAS